MSIDLQHGDCLELMRAIPDASVDLILCDLPYGTTACKWDSCIPLEPLWNQYKRIAKGAIVLTAQTPFDKVLGASNMSMLHYEWIWQKNIATGFLNAKKAPLKAHENILVFYKTLPLYDPQMRLGYRPYSQKARLCKSTVYGKQSATAKVSKGERYPLSVLCFSKDTSRMHPTQKPVALMEYLVRTYTKPGDIVLDNCMGSGTTGVACVNSGRGFIGIERDEAYFRIACERISKQVTELAGSLSPHASSFCEIEKESS